MRRFQQKNTTSQLYQSINQLGVFDDRLFFQKLNRKTNKTARIRAKP